MTEEIAGQEYLVRVADPDLAADIPAGIPIAPSFKMNVFCASENFEAFIVLWLRTLQLYVQINHGHCGWVGRRLVSGPNDGDREHCATDR